MHYFLFYKSIIDQPQRNELIFATSSDIANIAQNAQILIILKYYSGRKILCNYFKAIFHGAKAIQNCFANSLCNKAIFRVLATYLIPNC